MKIVYLSLLPPLFSVWMAFGAVVNITGTVLKTGGGPLKDVSVSLAGVTGVSANTDSQGKFTLLSPSKVIAIKGSKSISLKFGWRERYLVFYPVSGTISGNVSVFSAQGRQLISTDFSDLLPLTQRLTLPLFAPGLAILRITVNNTTYTCPIIEMGNTTYLKVSGSTGMENVGPARVMTALIADTLVARKNGYSDKKTPINSYTLSDMTISMDSAASCNATTLKEAGACGNNIILIGAAISPGKLTDLAAREFNYVTPENDMKWQNTEGSEGVFNYSQADAIVTWAQQKGIKVKGHCLVWHNQLPGWVTQAKGRDRVLGIMKKHIETLMGHFGDNVQAWDVVNEAFKTDTTNGSGNAQMRSSVFYNEIGPAYIDSAYKIARNYADSHNMKDMKLYYNEYSIGADNDKSRFARKTIKEWIDRGVPIDGIGFQMHLGPCYNVPTVETVKDNIQYYADLGLEVLISEWDINLCAGQVSKEQQLQWYYDITKICVNQPKCVAITFWGINDSESWLNTYSSTMCNGANSQSLLFDNGQKKDTYYQVLNALNGK
jgi:endo-1,4-beta-xylanase